MNIPYLEPFRNVTYSYETEDDTFIARGLQLNMMVDKIKAVMDFVESRLPEDVTNIPILGADTIDEYTLDGGVTIEGVPIKDNLVDGIDVSEIPNTYYSRVLLDGGQLDTRYYTETEVDGLFTAHGISADHDGRYYTETEVDGLFTAHNISSDHDGRYYTETELQTSGQASVHADNLTNDNHIVKTFSAQYTTANINTSANVLLGTLPQYAYIIDVKINVVTATNDTVAVPLYIGFGLSNAGEILSSSTILAPGNTGWYSAVAENILTRANNGANIATAQELYIWTEVDVSVTTGHFEVIVEYIVANI